MAKLNDIKAKLKKRFYDNRTQIRDGGYENSSPAEDSEDSRDPGQTFLSTRSEATEGDSSTDQYRGGNTGRDNEGVIEMEAESGVRAGQNEVVVRLDQETVENALIVESIEGMETGGEGKSNLMVVVAAAVVGLVLAVLMVLVLKRQLA